jgi:selenocysteine-specific elongation factor
VEAEVRLFDGASALAPGACAYARLVLHEPQLLLPGDRFIVRMFSPVITIGGGVVLDATGHRYRRGEPAHDRLATLEHGTSAQRVSLLVRESKYGLGLAELIAATGLVAAEIERAAEADELVALEQPEFRLLDREWFRAALTRITNVLRTFHQQHPLAAGMSKEELRSRELPGAPAFLLDALAGRASGIVVEGETVRLAAHRVVLKQDEEQASGAIEAAFRAAGLDAPALDDVLGKAGIEPVRARTLLQMLLRRGTLVKIGDMVFHRESLATLRGKLTPHKGRRLSVLQFKELAGVSRKYAIPLLEYLDRERVTRREGDERLVL